MFLLAAFLLLPVLASLFFLIILVCLVLEPILSALLSLKISHLEQIFLTFTEHNVKNIIRTTLLSICCIAQSYALETIVLSTGEQKTLKLGPSSKYSIGNKDVLKHKVLKSENAIIIKGARVGFSDLILWQGNKQKNYKIFILDKRAYLKNYQIIDILNNNGIKYASNGQEPIITKGVIKTKESYYLLHRLLLKSTKLISHSRLDKKLRNKFIANTYIHFLEQGMEYINCKFRYTDIFCTYSDINNEYAKDIKNYSKLYYIKFIKAPYRHHSNYRISFKILKIKNSNGKHFSLGMNEINSLVKNIYSYGEKALFDNNSVRLGERELQVETLASPVSVTQLNSPVSIQLGQENIYGDIETNGIAVVKPIWKFSGLKINLELKIKGGHYSLTYKTVLTDSSEGGISGNQGSSTLLLKENVPTQIFQIGIKSKSNEKSQIPILGNIPVLGNLFKSSQNVESFQYLYGIVKVEKI